MLSTQGLARLVELQEGAVEEAKLSHQKWLCFQKDYNDLKDKLTHLPDEVSYDYMVPYGPLAFMPGKLVHTNEILVLLGDNWFAEMSAKQASDIVDRRLKGVDEMLEKLQKQIELLESQKDFSAQTLGETKAGLHDITEEYDSDQERQWRDKHKARMREHRKKELEAEKSTHDDLLARLGELQLQEMRDSEMSKVGVSSSMTLDNGKRPDVELKFNKDNAKSVRWEKDTQIQPDSTTDLSIPIHGDGTDSSLDSDDSLPENIIFFKHSPRDEAESTPQQSSQLEMNNIQSPADLYTIFHKPKSILKQSSSNASPPNDPAPYTSDKEPAPPAFQRTTAVNQHVKERSNPTNTGFSLTDPPDHSSKEPPPSKPISKFKQMKSKR